MEQIENGRIDFSGISSKEAEELIRKLLVVDPEGRRSVSEILRSPWFEEEEEKEIVDVFEEFALEDFSGSFEIFC
jgi:serine/threonine protein kinase